MRNLEKKSSDGGIDPNTSGRVSRARCGEARCVTELNANTAVYTALPLHRGEPGTENTQK